MRRFTGTVGWLARCPGLVAVVDWIKAIPFEDWPQQTRLADGRLRPAMVSDLAWHGFGAVTEELVQHLAGLVGGVPAPNGRLLSAVMPGATIDPHADRQGPAWVARVHVPLLTNDSSWFVCGGGKFLLLAGHAYLVNTEVVHAVVNEGETPRVHLMIDYREA
jgi:Aspartyl/Asparaginyl beta-hydroxylase